MSAATTTQQAAPFHKVLVANRGEIAVRIIRTLRELGITAVAVYSDADRDALHVRLADEAWSIGGQLPGDSYLNGEKILEVARAAGAQAIHPGYGFLAENAGFAQACADAGIVFVGPSPDAIERMGSKTTSRSLMQDAGVPIVPGTTEPIETLGAAEIAAQQVGYPIAVKARSGGGGKGFRVALTADDLPGAFEGAAREGERYFSDAAVYLERYLPDPRHVEVQVLGDQHGCVVHLGERDCSIQRRHQKLVEESPSPTANGALRTQLADIALGAARAVGYTSAGTIECLLDGAGNAYFLEMNTRVQVEHTVTELVTGIDIVAEQLYIAAGRPLPFAQADIDLRGHAIEVRINAEDATLDFRPSSGPITAYREPGGLGVRVDSGISIGSVVTPFYDTLLAKLIVWAPDRPRAIARMVRALDEYEVAGVTTLIPFHRALIASPQFAAAEACRELVADPAALIAASQSPSNSQSPSPSPSQSRPQSPSKTPSQLRPQTHSPSPTQTGETATRTASEGGRLLAAAVPDTHVVEVDGRRYDVTIYDPVDPAHRLPPPVRDRAAHAAGAAGDVIAPIPGNVLQVLVKTGQIVAAGEVLCILEAMKMENEITAPVNGLVESIAVAAGDAVAAGQMLLHVTTEGTSSAAAADMPVSAMPA